AESILQPAQRAIGRGQALYRSHPMAACLDGVHQASAHRLAVEQYRARAADSVLAADVRSGEPQVVAKPVHERQPCGDAPGTADPVHVYLDLVQRFTHAASAFARDARSVRPIKTRARWRRYSEEACRSLPGL